MNFKRNNLSRRLYLSIMGVFLVFDIAFIIFQQHREKQYKVSTLELRLQSFNREMADALDFHSISTMEISAYIKKHATKDMRVTLVTSDGRVFYDNMHQNYRMMSNHRNRPEIAKALANGEGSTVERKSRTMKQDYFYSATFLPHQNIIIRSALPYNDNLAKSLQADQHYIWFALLSMVVLTLVLYRFMRRLDYNINKLKIFATRADHNESLEIKDLTEFSGDELGEIAERIIKIYKRLERTRKEQDTLKRQLTQNIAHELKTPVASIQGYLETITSHPELKESDRRLFLSHCLAQTERLSSLIADISVLNKMDDGQAHMKVESININDFIEQIRKETALDFKKQNMHFEISMPDAIIINGVASLVYSIFRNLVDNAISYAGTGTTVRLVANQIAGGWHFAFSDDGPGIESRHLTRIFERFYRVDKGRSRKKGGTGLGLSIVKNAVQLHGGNITASNVSGGGLRFDFNLKNNAVINTAEPTP